VSEAAVKGFIDSVFIV